MIKNILSLYTIGGYGEIIVNILSTGVCSLLSYLIKLMLTTMICKYAVIIPEICKFWIFEIITKMLQFRYTPMDTNHVFIAV